METFRFGLGSFVCNQFVQNIQRIGAQTLRNVVFGQFKFGVVFLLVFRFDYFLTELIFRFGKCFSEKLFVEVGGQAGDAVVNLIELFLMFEKVQIGRNV